MIHFVGQEDLFRSNNVKNSTIQDVYDYCKDKKILSIDIETTRKYNKYGDIEGLDPYTSKIVMLQIGDLERQYIIDIRYNTIDMLLPLLEDNNIIKVGHNLKFEYKHLLHNYGVRINNLYDTQIVEQIIKSGYPNIKFSLEALIKKYLNTQVNKSTRLEFLNIESKPFSLTQLNYGAEDIIYPLKIRELQLPKVKQLNLEHTVYLEMKFTPVLGEIEYTGMNFNTDKWLKTYQDNKIQFDLKAKELDNYVLTNNSNSNFISKQLDLFNPDPKVLIQWTSSKQVIGYFIYLDICPKEVSKTTNKLSYTVNAKVLKSSLNTINKNKSDKLKSLINLYIDFKEIEQSVTTFGKDFLKHINPITGRLHSNYKQILNTGRISSSSPNLQNIPSDIEFRHAFDAPKGWKIVNADYAGQETVVLANKSKESNIMNLINTGGDMHCFVTKAIHPELKELTDDEIKANHKDKRQVAKAAGFAIQYGGTGFTIASNLGITEEEGNRVYDSYFIAFPELKKYFKKVQNEAIKKGYILIDKVIGRKAFFLRPNNNKEKHAIFKKALNYPIQGESGNITKLACIYFYQWILDNNLIQYVRFSNVVHDELNVECKENYSKLVAKNLEECMVKAGGKWCKDVPLKAEAAVVDYWSH